MFGPVGGCYIDYAMGTCFLHLSMTLRIRRYCLLAHSVLVDVLVKVFAISMPRESVPALTSDPSYLSILFPGSFGSGRRC